MQKWNHNIVSLEHTSVPRKLIDLKYDSQILSLLKYPCNSVQIMKMFSASLMEYYPKPEQT